MRLKLLEYSQDTGTSREWQIRGLELGDVNLLVGPNASGKSRSLAVINNIAKLVSGEVKFTLEHGEHRLLFSHESGTVQYDLAFRQSRIISEEYRIDERVLLDRKEGGEGRIFAQRLNDSIDFQTPDTELAVVARRDAIQHNFFDPLYRWGKSTLHYPFSTALGQDNLVKLVKDGPTELDLKDSSMVVPVFRKGEKEFGDRFTQSIVDDMAVLNYPLDSIGCAPPYGLIISNPLLRDIVGLCVRERGHQFDTTQNEMSRGMFRALSVLIQLNYAVLAANPACILIDDIGEGLDFERSCALIRLLMGKAGAAGVQLVMSTNDQFVMNAVPLKAWSVLRRSGSVCRVYNYHNSKAAFDEFRFTGLSNFDFFATNFVEEGTAANEEDGDLRGGADGATVRGGAAERDSGAETDPH